MKLYYRGMFIGMVEPNEYTVHELEAAGFTVIIK